MLGEFITSQLGTRYMASLSDGLGVWGLSFGVSAGITAAAFGGKELVMLGGCPDPPIFT